MSEINHWIDSGDGRYRAVLETEVPGTAEEVWQVIATGPGIEAWFVPAQVEEHEGGAIITHHGDYGDSEGVITAWEPPRRLVYEERDDVPAWNTEMLVEATSGSTCRVRLSSGFLDRGEEWKDMVDGTLYGWVPALRNLQIYLRHFAGLPTTTLLIQHEIPGAGQAPDALDALGLSGAKVGDEVQTGSDTPRLCGIVEYLHDDVVAIRTSEPTSGIFGIASSGYGTSAGIIIQGSLYGEEGPSVRDREEPLWRERVKRLHL